MTSREAVISAIREYDQIGQDAFLEKHGFGKALRYFVDYEGRFYDSKAIASAAYSYEFPGEEWGNRFKGGEGIARLLNRLGFAVTRPAERAGEISVELVDLEKAVALEFEVTPVAGTIAARRSESTLVGEFAAHLRQVGHELARHRIRVFEGNSSLATDLFDVTDEVLYEAKSSVDRSTIRLGLGQILDYRRFLDPEIECQLLLPSRPIQELVALLSHYGVGVTWRDGGNWRHEPAAAGW